MTELRASLSAIEASFLVEVRRTVRDRRTLILVFLMPAVIATIVVYALSADEDAGPVTIGWVTASDDASVDLFRQRVVDSDDLAGVVEWRRFTSERIAAQGVAAAEPGAAIVVRPPSTGGAVELRLLAAEDPVAAGVAATIIDRYRVGHAVATMAAEAGAPTPTGERALGVPVTAPAGASLDAAVHWGPSLAVFFVLLAMGHAAHRQVEDRHRDVVARLGAVPCGPAPIVIGRSLAATSIGAASLLTMAATTRVVFGRAWGPWPQLVIVAGATALAVAGIGAVIAAWSTTPGRAQSLTALAAFGLAIAGGGFSTLGSNGAPTGLAKWLPTSLSLDAFGTATTTARWGALVVPLMVLAGTGVVLSAVGSLRTRRPAA